MTPAERNYNRARAVKPVIPLPKRGVILISPETERERHE